MPEINAQTGSTNPALKTRVPGRQFLIREALPATKLQRLLCPHRPVRGGLIYFLVRVQKLCTSVRFDSVVEVLNMEVRKERGISRAAP